jgi:hypothetical protein
MMLLFFILLILVDGLIYIHDEARILSEKFILDSSSTFFNQSLDYKNFHIILQQNNHSRKCRDGNIPSFVRLYKAKLSVDTNDIFMLVLLRQRKLHLEIGSNLKCHIGQHLSLQLYNLLREKQYEVFVNTSIYQVGFCLRKDSGTPPTIRVFFFLCLVGIIVYGAYALKNKKKRQ